ncbi:MAG: hypothetical protein CL917_08425 [Deltaproteobacteria bacterium]|nr:hypothetical protein [Deltaproteobacteria bacterium]
MGVLDCIFGGMQGLPIHRQRGPRQKGSFCEPISVAPPEGKNHLFSKTCGSATDFIHIHERGEGVVFLGRGL